MALTEAWNMDFIDAQYRMWKEDPDTVSRDWRFFFEGFEIAEKGNRPSVEPTCDLDQTLKQSRVDSLKYRYRDLGHLLACLDPLERAVVVGGLPHLATGPDPQRGVVHHGRERELGIPLALPLQGGKRNDRLERAARLAPRLRGPVELRPTILGATHHGEDLAGARVERHQRRLDLAGLPPQPAHPTAHR